MVGSFFGHLKSNTPQFLRKNAKSLLIIGGIICILIVLMLCYLIKKQYMAIQANKKDEEVLERQKVLDEEKRNTKEIIEETAKMREITKEFKKA